jgi:HTH-type transcriptional regulator/antitoxin HigA
MRWISIVERVLSLGLVTRAKRRSLEKDASESQYIKEIEGNSIEALKLLLEEHGLKQSDLSEIGSQGVVSEILFGKRQLNVRQIKLLSNRFKVSPAVFI